MKEIYIVVCFTKYGGNKALKYAYPTKEKVLKAIEKARVEKPLGNGIYYYSELYLINEQEDLS